MLHIGHLKAIVADFEGLPGSTCRPVCGLRYDNTNPAAETEQYRQGILDDLKWLGYTPKTITNTSDYFIELYGFMLYLLDHSMAFYEWGDISQQRSVGAPSPTRHISGRDFLESEKVPCIRVKIAPDHKMTAMRDPVIFRYKSAANGHKAGWYPTYDFSHPIVDYLEDITDSYCTREFFIRRQLYYWFVDLYREYELNIYGAHRHQIPEVFEFSRLELEGVKLSKRHMLKEITEGHAKGFDDPKLFTVSGLRARGHSPEALKHFCRNYVDYKASDGGPIMMHKFEHALREYYESHCIRRFGIPCLDALKVNIDQSGKPEHLMVTRPNHPSTDMDMGERTFTTDLKHLYINRVDFNPNGNRKYKRLKTNGNKVYLKYGPLVSYTSHVPDGELCLALHKEGKSGAAIQWLDAMDAVKLVSPDGTEWYCEGDLKNYEGIVQLERCGYYHVKDGLISHLLDLKSGYTDT